MTPTLTLSLDAPGFHRDALPHEPYAEAEARANAEARPAQGLTYLWEVEEEPVAMAARLSVPERSVPVSLLSGTEALAAA